MSPLHENAKKFRIKANQEADNKAVFLVIFMSKNLLKL